MCSRTDLDFISLITCVAKKRRWTVMLPSYSTREWVMWACTPTSPLTIKDINNIQCLQWWSGCFLASLAAHDNYTLSLIQRYHRNCVCVRCCSVSSYRTNCALSTLPPLLSPTAVIIQPHTRVKQHHVHVGGRQRSLGLQDNFVIAWKNTINKEDSAVL